MLYPGPRADPLHTTINMRTNGSNAEFYAGMQVPLLDTNSSINCSNGSQHGATSLDLRRAVPVGMVLAFFIMFAIVGNILVILAVVCNRHLRIPTNYFIINLAIADLLLGTTVLPVSATLEVRGRYIDYRLVIEYRIGEGSSLRNK